MIKDYIIKERLGTGAFGIVYKVLKKSNNNIYVIKQMPLLGLTPQQIKEAKSEARILSSVRSSYIVRYFESFEEKNYLHIVMEYCDGGDLNEFLNKNKKTRYLLKEDLIWNIFLKITIGLATLHKSNILHRDLKTLNIFMTKNLDIKIGDFGVAKILTKSGFAKTVIGTPYYLSPELCDEKPYNNKSDVWALGCILYELSTYKHPFNAKCQASLILKILEYQPNPIPKYYSENLQKLIYLILDKNYITRPSCNDILNLPFVIKKAKALNIYDKIKELYLPLNENKKIENNYSNRTFIHQEEKKNKKYEQNTVPSKEINKKYNKINSTRYLKSEQNVKMNNKNLISKQEQGKRRHNNYNNHVLFISKSNDNFKKIKNIKENRSKSCEKNKNQLKERIKTNHIINISNLDNISNNKINNINNLDNINNNRNKINSINNLDNISNNNRKKISNLIYLDNNNRNKINNISYINVSNNSNINNNKYQNHNNKDINSYRNNKVINSINEFEKKIKNKSKNNIKKMVIINNNTKENIKNSYDLNIEDEFLKNIKITDILDNQDIDIIIQNKLSQKNNNNKIINMKEFANYLNSYVSKVNQTDIKNNQNNKKSIINKNNNNYKPNLNFNKEINNNINKINNNKYNKNNLSNNYSVDLKLNQKYYEKLVVNNIYNIKENKNSKIISKANIHNIYKNFNNLNDGLEKEKIKNINKTQSNKVLLHNQNLFNKKKNIENRINSAIYNKNRDNIKRHHIKLDKQKISKYSYKYNSNSFYQSYSQQKIIKYTEKNNYKITKTNSDIYDFD